MSSYEKSRLEIFEFSDKLKFDLPLAIDDMSLAHHLGIQNRTLWWVVHKKAGHYNVFAIPKRGKKKEDWRKIQSPKARLKAIQRNILGKFLAPIPVGPHVGAYVAGRSCKDTALQHVGKGTIISLDIKDFFPSVKRWMIRRYFNYIGYAHHVSSLLAELLTYENFVPQGAPTSGAIANLVADLRFDRAIIQDLRELDPRWVYTRYSDDIDISHPERQTQEQTKQVIDIAYNRITRAGFRINAKKVHVDRDWRRQKVLGIVVNKKPNIQRAEYMHVRCLIHNCAMHGFESQLERSGKPTVDALLAYIRGKISYFKQINEEKAIRLADDLQAALAANQQKTEDDIE